MEKIGYRAAVLMVFILGIESGMALGQEDPEIHVDPIIIERTGNHEAEKDPSVSATIITLEEEREKFKTLADILSGIVGVELKSTGSMGQRSSVSIRGLDSQQVVVMLDGFRLNTSQGGGVDLSMLPVEHIKEIEVIRGGASSMYGTDAIGGAINLRLSDLDGQADENRLKITFGSFQTVLGAFSRMAHADPIDYLISYVHRQSKGNFRYINENQGPQTRLNNASLQESLLTKGKITLGPLTRLEWLADVQFTDRGSPGLIEFPMLEAHERLWRAVTGITYKRNTLLDGLLDLESRLFFKLNIASYTNPKPYLGPSVSNRNQIYLIENETALSFVIADYHVLKGLITFGADFASISKRDQSVQSPHRVFGSILAQDELYLLKDRLIIVTALRLDSAEKYPVTVVPKAGIVVKPFGPFFFKANVSRAFRFPSFDELYFDSGTVRGNQKLHAESAWTFDMSLGIESPILSLAATYFYAKITNLILFLPKTVYLIEADDSQGAISTGLELAMTFAPSKYFQMGASYTFTKAYFDESPQFRLPLRPENRLNIRFTGGVKWVSLYFELCLQDAFSFDRYESNFEEGRVDLNAGLSVNIFDFLVASIDAKNLTDNRTRVDSLQYPLPGFELYGTLTGKF